jgi:hypothetical protein
MSRDGNANTFIKFKIFLFSSFAEIVAMNLSLLLSIIYLTTIATAQVNEIKKFTVMDFKFPTEAQRQQAISSRLYVPENIIPIDVDVDYRGTDLNQFIPLFSLIIFQFRIQIHLAMLAYLSARRDF